jgi:hypothetical protein
VDFLFSILDLLMFRNLLLYRANHRIEWDVDCYFADDMCATSPCYVLPAGARNPDVTPLPRPHGLRPHWSLCRKRVCNGEDLRHTPPPDHLAQVAELPIGVYFGDDGSGVYPNDLHLCCRPSNPDAGRSC